MFFLLRRILFLLLSLIVLSFAVFLVVKAIPGDPAQLKLGERATPEALAQVRAELGLDKPLLTQFGIFLEKLVLEQDLGRSIQSGALISQELKERFPATFELTLVAGMIAMLLGIPLGICAALRPGSWIDLSTMSISAIGVSLPIFWLAMLAIWLFGATLGLLPLSGRMGVEFVYEPMTGFLVLDALLAGDVELFKSALLHLVMPSLCLATHPTAFCARVTRAAMMDVCRQDYMRTARAKGYSFATTVWKHGLKNASLPIVTMLALQFGMLLGGAIITETVFAWPGMGSWIVQAVGARDIPALQGGIFVIAICFVMINAGVDMLYVVLDPRLRVR